MSLYATFLVALAALRRNALRSMLAMLGIVIGVASVTVMISIGRGAQIAVDNQIAALGANLIMVVPGSFSVGPRQGGAGSAVPFSDNDVLAIRQKVPFISGISGVVQASSVFVVGNVNWTAPAFGIGEDYLEVRDWALLEGRNFNPAEQQSAAKVVILGATPARELFGDRSAMGQTVRIRNVPFQVIGLLAPKGQSLTGQDQDDLALVPINTARRRLFGRSSTVRDVVGTIVVEAEEGAPMAEVQAEIEDLLRLRRKVKAGQRDNFSVRNMEEFVRARTETQNTLGLLLAATAAISLVVGGIGIMNIMLVSVTERTREIGLRMAVGARRRDILAQFLVEAVNLCALGGLAGIALGVAATYAIAGYGNWPVVVGPDVMALALLSAAGTGVFFGFYPARRAAALNPIQALRFE
jgi:putative ABC transport system permease protein